MKGKVYAVLLSLSMLLRAAAGTYYTQTFNSGFQNNGAVPDGSLNGWSDTHTVSGSGTHHVADVRVTLTISGGYNGDLYAYLVHASGQAVLLNRVGVGSSDPMGYGNPGFDVTFSSAGAANIHSYQSATPSYDGSGRLTGTWKPDGRGIDPLSAAASFDATGTADFGVFSGVDPNGDWTLYVADVSGGGGQSTVVGWGLQIDTVVEPAINLVVTSVNGGSGVVAGTPFAVAVQSQDLNGLAAAVVADTAVSLSINSGSGTLGGTLTGTISAGSSSVTITGVTYTKAENGVILTATRTSGDTLQAANSSSFNVVPGAFAKLQVLMPGETAAPGSATGKTGTPNAQTVASSLSLTVNAVDANWNLISTNDTVSITSSDGSAVLPANAALASGTGTFNLTFMTAGTQTVTASDVTHPAITAGTSANTTVNKGDQTITFTSPGNQTYGVAPISLSASASSGLAVSLSIVSGPASVSGTTLTITGAGSVTIAAAQAGDANWNAATTVNQTISVAAKSLVPSITATGKTYDGSNSATIATRNVTGVQPGDTVALSGGTATFADKTVGTGKTVTATGLTLSGPDASKYTLSTTTATATADISALGLTISGAVAQNKVYDDTTTATVNFTGASLVGVISPDVATINSTGYSAHFNDKLVGTGKTVTVTGVTLGGADAGNYTVSQPSGLTADITAGNVTKLVFTTEPGSATAGATLGQQPIVATQDQYGNPSTAGLAAHLNVTMTLTSGTGTLQGTVTLDIGTAAGNGSVSYTNLRIDAAGNKQLTASASGLTSAVSSTFSVPNVAPVAGTLSVQRPRNVPIKILISDLLAQCSDANGDTVTLTAVSTSVHGSAIYTNATYILYSVPAGGNISDSFTYTVSDGTLTTQGTVQVTIAADPSDVPPNHVSSGLDVSNHPTMVFAGVPGYTYVIQRVQDLSGTPPWVTLTTITAPANGLISYTDTNPPAGNVFYRVLNQ